MRKSFWTLLIFALLFSTHTFAQDSKVEAKGTPTPETATIQTLKFTMDAPTDNFILDEVGTSYQWTEGNAMLQFLAMPGNYKDMAGSVEAMYSAPNMELLFNEKKKYAGQEGDLLKVRLKADEGSGHDDFFFLMYLMPHEHGFVMLSASYPTSQDNDLYDKILTSFDSFREEK